MGSTQDPDPKEPTTTRADGAPSIASRTSRALQARQERSAPAPTPPEVAEPATDEATTVEPAIDDAAAEPATTDAAAEPENDDAAEVAEPADADEPAAVGKPASTSTVTRAGARTSSRTAATRSPRRAQAKAATDRRAPSRLILAVSAVTVVALLFAVVTGVLWWRADRDAGSSVAESRDAAVQAASQDVVALNTADYRHAEAALAKWESVATGKLAAEFTSGGKDVVAALKKAKLVTTATVQDAAVTSLDTSKGTATVIASVYIKRQPVRGAATTSRNRFRATLTRVDGHWRLADLAAIAVQLS